jgi:serine/threonine protein kinase, bacterial
MGEVFLAADETEQRSVAIKVIKPVSPDPDEQRKFLQYFKKEAKLLQKLSHPHLVKVFGTFDHFDRACMVMEFITGDSLFDRLEKRSKPFASKNVLKWTGQLLDVLSYLHNQPSPVIVRDIKPHNIVLNQAGDVRLIDFGIAKELEPGKATSTALKGIGSEGFAPLEQYGHSTTDERSDIYSLGATLYYLLTGVVPPDAVSRATKQATLQDIRSLVPTIDSTLATTIYSMLALNPDERPPSIEQIHKILSATSTAPLSGAPAPPPTTHPQNTATTTKAKTKTSSTPEKSGIPNSLIVMGVAFSILIFMVFSANNQKNQSRKTSPEKNHRTVQTVSDPTEVAAENPTSLDSDLSYNENEDTTAHRALAAIADPDAKYTNKNLYAHALAILAIDRNVDAEIIEITTQLNASGMTVPEAQRRVEQLENRYKSRVFVLNRKENFQARTLFSQVIAERHEKVIMSNISDPDGVLSDPTVRSRMPMVTFSNLFLDLSAAQMKRLSLLNQGLKQEIRSGIESARPIYDTQLQFVNQYQEARASVDRILVAPD